jgi:hypothetical protein
VDCRLHHSVALSRQRSPLKFTLQVRATRKTCRTARGAASLVAAFQLHGYPIAGSTAVDGTDPAWVFPGRAQVPLVLPGRSDKSAVLTAAGFNAVMATVKLLDRYNEVISARNSG